MTVFAWQATCTSLTFLLAGQLQGLVILNNENYVPERWHTTLIMWAAVGVTYVQNLWGIKLLPMIEVFVGVWHILAFIAVFLVMLIMGRNASTKFVFTGFINETGWKNDGIAWFIGLLPSIWCIVGTFTEASSASALLELTSRQDLTAQSTCRKRPSEAHT